MANDIVADLLNTVDVKISANSRSFNVDVHVYEHTNKEKIDQVIDNALYAMRETQQRIRTELMTEA
jgi:predicted secreted protein